MPSNDDYEVGYGKPPKATRFRKGVSGNPTGRPKGSRSISSILAKLGRERVKVTTNGKTRTMTKLEVVFTQLNNQAASGNLKAIRELLSAHRLFAEPQQIDEITPAARQEHDEGVLKNIAKRVRVVITDRSDQRGNRD